MTRNSDGRFLEGKENRARVTRGGDRGSEEFPTACSFQTERPPVWAVSLYFGRHDDHIPVRLTYALFVHHNAYRYEDYAEHRSRTAAEGGQTDRRGEEDSARPPGSGGTDCARECAPSRSTRWD